MSHHYLIFLKEEESCGGGTLTLTRKLDIFYLHLFFSFNVNHFSLSLSPANVGTILIFAGGHPGFPQTEEADLGWGAPQAALRSPCHISNSARAATSSLCGDVGTSSCLMVPNSH